MGAPSSPVQLMPHDQVAASEHSTASGAASAAVTERDYTEVPQEMNKAFENLDEDNALRPTIIGLGETWSKTEQKALLAKPSIRSLDAEAQKVELNAAFDLLDALTRSGAL